MKIIFLGLDGQTQIAQTSMRKPREPMPESILFTDMVFVHAPLLDPKDERCTARKCYYQIMRTHRVRQLDAADEIPWNEARRDSRFEL